MDASEVSGSDGRDFRLGSEHDRQTNPSKKPRFGKSQADDALSLARKSVGLTRSAQWTAEPPLAAACGVWWGRSLTIRHSKSHERR
jgi:hypothetical protein